MRIAVLGPLEVSTDDGAPVTVPGAKERLLLALLAAASPDVVSTDRIVETLWNGNRPASARKSLQVHLVHLRSALEPDRPRGETGGFVVRRGSGYALTTAPDDVDALRFGELVRAGAPGWPRASRRRPCGCSPPRSGCGGGSPTATGRTRRSPTRSGVG